MQKEDYYVERKQRLEEVTTRNRIYPYLFALIEDKDYEQAISIYNAINTIYSFDLENRDEMVANKIISLLKQSNYKDVKLSSIEALEIRDLLKQILTL